MSDAIAAFIRARLDEDEQVARGVSPGCSSTWELMELGDGYGVGYLSIDSARVLAEVAAKRAILAEHPKLWDDDPSVCRVCEDRTRHDAAEWLCWTVRLLASCWSDHPDYDPSWGQR